MQHVKKSKLNYSDFHYIIVSKESDEISLEILGEKYAQDNVLKLYDDEEFIRDIEVFVQGKANKLVTEPFSADMSAKKYFYMFSFRPL